MATLDDFMRLDIRVGTITEAKTFEKARRPAYQLWVDLGEEIGVKKTSAQITDYYKPEDLIGKKLGIVCNLAPRPMMKGKYVSEGMIFAADTDVDGGCAIAFFPDSTPAGARIH